MEKTEEYYNNLDKRTKEYKEYKQSKGLGDTIEKITKATGIDKLVKFIAGEDCGCEERKKYLNEKFAYRRKPNCLEEEDYNWLNNFFGVERRAIRPSEQRDMNIIHEKVFGYKEGTCEGCVRTMVSNLKIVWQSYGE